MENEYHESVSRLEAGLLPCAKRSFETQSPTFVDGSEIFSHFAQQWRGPNQLKLMHRTPIQLERDRILYSQGMRKQTEKYHVLYNGQRRIVRAYATHTMKMAQVARAVARGMSLNQDFAEAVALGAKVGAVPFVHAAKNSIGIWAEEKIRAVDSQHAKESPLGKQAPEQLRLDFEARPIPSFVAGLHSSTVFDKVRRYMPWAAGDSSARLYASGQESYWLLCTNPFTVESRRETHYPETMYGIWRHSRGIVPASNSFKHRCQLTGAKSGYNEITDAHATFEAILVQYSDDITWAIENLNDANDVALLNAQARGVYEDLKDYLTEDIDPGLSKALSKNDAGGIYSYFIGDFVRYSASILQKGGNGPEIRVALTKGDPTALIGLSPEANNVLDRMIEFLGERVFVEPRTKNRTEMLRSVSAACVELVYASEDVLPRVVDEQSRLARWKPEATKAAHGILDDPIHRVQLSMDVLASWGDQEIYDFVGIQSL